MSKWLALTLMLIDHLAIILEPQISYNIYAVMRGIGRLSFPLFVYFLAIGLGRTSNIKKYVSRIFIFAVLSEVVQRLLVSEYIGAQNLNVLFSLTIYSIFYMMFFEESDGGLLRGLKTISKILISVVLLVIISKVDYSYSGFLLFLGILYIHRSNIKHKRLYTPLVIFLSFAPSVMSNQTASIQLVSVLSGLIMFTPKLEERVFHPIVEKWVFYLTYPMQWILFYLLSKYIFLIF